MIKWEHLHIKHLTVKCLYKMHLTEICKLTYNDTKAPQNSSIRRKMVKTTGSCVLPAAAPVCAAAAAAAAAACSTKEVRIHILRLSLTAFNILVSKVWALLMQKRHGDKNHVAQSHY